MIMSAVNMPHLSQFSSFLSFLIAFACRASLGAVVGLFGFAIVCSFLFLCLIVM